MDDRSEADDRGRAPRRGVPRPVDRELDLRRAAERPDESVHESADERVEDPDGPEGDDEVLGFDELYDPDELAAIEAGPRAPSQPATKMGQWRRTSAVGAVLTGLALGFQEVFDPEEERSIEIEVDADGEPVDLPVRLFLDPDSPAGSLAIVSRSDNAKPPVV